VLIKDQKLLNASLGSQDLKLPHSPEVKTSKAHLSSRKNYTSVQEEYYQKAKEDYEECKKEQRAVRMASEQKKVTTKSVNMKGIAQLSGQMNQTRAAVQLFGEKIKRRSQLLNNIQNSSFGVMNIQDVQTPAEQELIASMSESKRDIRNSRTSHFFLPAASAKVDSKS